MITVKKWVYRVYRKGKLSTENNKIVVPKRELFQVLSQHMVKFPTEDGKLWKSGFTKIMQKSARKLLTSKFVKTCPFHTLPEKMSNAY